MWQDDAVMLEDVDVADWRPSLAVGDAVCARAGTSDPDFPDRQLDGWSGMIVEIDETVAPAQYLVQWDRNTVSGMSPDCRSRCETEDFVFDQMWLLEDDLNILPLYNGMDEAFI